MAGEAFDPTYFRTGKFFDEYFDNDGKLRIQVEGVRDETWSGTGYGAQTQFKLWFNQICSSNLSRGLTALGSLFPGDGLTLPLENRMGDLRVNHSSAGRGQDGVALARANSLRQLHVGRSSMSEVTRMPYILANVSRMHPKKTCEMICYLWFSVSLLSPAATPPLTPPYSPEIPAATSSLHLTATPTFVTYMHKLLATTQVSQSVIVLSLHYIRRLKERTNRFTAGLPGTTRTPTRRGRRFLVLSMAEITRMEKEFLAGVDFNLYILKKTKSLADGVILAPGIAPLAILNQCPQHQFAPTVGGATRHSIAHVRPRPSNPFILAYIHPRMRISQETHGAAPKALFCVSARMAENVFVITATNKLISQMFSTWMQTMKKKQETKNSASMIEYMIGDRLKEISVTETWIKNTYAIG
ncbi:hypothetical protein EDD22DRAFT_1011504 [Suillus occidentalis]|nr:hypothetical protein EDD22DRAFT_1011504 [Suillus occidentalis]